MFQKRINCVFRDAWISERVSISLIPIAALSVYVCVFVCMRVSMSSLFRDHRTDISFLFEMMMDITPAGDPSQVSPEMYKSRIIFVFESKSNLTSCNIFFSKIPQAFFYLHFFAVFFSHIFYLIYYLLLTKRTLFQVGFQ